MAEGAVGSRSGASGRGWRSTLRISNIPTAITHHDLCEQLAGVATATGDMEEDTSWHRGDNLRFLSLAPSPSNHDSSHFQVATATFSQVPDHTGSLIRLGPPHATFQANVDTHFEGLTPLNNPSNPTIDIIAVTGLAGHAFGSWRSREGPEMWLRDFLPDDLERNGCNARILTYGYDTKLVGSVSDAGIFEISKQFLEAVKISRPRTERPTRPIVFIGHSLGGLVIKQAIIEAGNNDQGLLKPCLAVMFFGVPNRGLEGSHLLSMVKGQVNDHLVRDLCGNSQFLSLLDRAFYQLNCSLSSTLRVVSFYETKDTMAVEQTAPNKWTRSGRYVRMVTRESAMHSTSGECIPLDADHSTIVKFCCRSDQNYQIVLNKILEFAKALAEVVSSLPVVQRRGPTNKELSCLRSLVPDNNDPTIKTPHAKPQIGTCEWILSEEIFQDWRSTENPPKLLWIAGHPGTGKTVMMSYLLNFLQKRSAPVVFFFCDDKDEGQRTAMSILKSLVHQLLSIDAALFKHILPHYEQFRPGERPQWSFDTLWTVFSGIALDTDVGSLVVYCFIDALDECAESGQGEESRNDLLTRIRELYTSDCQIRLCVSSRPYKDLQACLEPSLTITLGQEPTKRDISRFIDDKLQVSFGRRFSNEVTNRVAEHLRSEAQGSFLWVALVLRDLASCFTNADVDDLLQNIPQGIFSYYDHILGRIPPKHRRRARMMFMWIAYSPNPMTLEELNTALAISSATPLRAEAEIPSTLTTEDIINRYQSNDLKLEIETRCGLLVEFRTRSDDNSCTIHFIHQSVKDYFTTTTQELEQSINHQEFYIAPLATNALLGGYCVTYLTLADFGDLDAREPVIENFLPLTDYDSFPPLSKYCAMSWPYYLRQSNALSPMTEKAFLKFQTSHAEHFKVWGSLFYRSQLLGDMRPIHAAAMFGLLDLATFLVKNGADLNEGYCYGLTPLTLAVRFQRKPLVELFLQSGVDPNAEILWGTTVLHNAVELHRTAMVELLVQNGVDLSRKDYRGYRALESAADSGTEAILRTIMEATPGVKDVTELLYIAVMGRNEKVFGFLIDAGANINKRSVGGWTPLHTIAVHGTKDMARILGDRGASINSRDDAGQTPLHLISGGDISRGLKQSDGSTRIPRLSMYIPSRKDTVEAEVVKILVDLGADMRAKDANGKTPLFTAATSDKKKVVKLLAELGADVNPMDATGETPWSTAVKTGKVEMASVLVELGADEDSTLLEPRSLLAWLWVDIYLLLIFWWGQEQWIPRQEPHCAAVVGNGKTLYVY